MHQNMITSGRGSQMSLKELHIGCSHCLEIMTLLLSIGMYLYFQDLLDPEKGYHNAKEDTVTLEVHVIADAPHGVR